MILPPTRVRGMRPFIEVSAILARNTLPFVHADVVDLNGSVLNYTGLVERFGDPRGLSLDAALALGVEKQFFSRINTQLAVTGGFRDRLNQFIGFQLSFQVTNKRGYFGEMSKLFRSI